MRRPLISQTPEIAKINVTPIIDVALVLVIILLITAPIMAIKDYDISLPPAETRGAEDELRIHISISKKGELAVDEDVVPPRHLGAMLRARFDRLERDDVLVVIRADEGIPYAIVRDVLHEAREGGAKRLAVATRQGNRRS